MKYVTKQGQRWDTIAYELWGNPHLYHALLLYNPQYAHLTVLPSGIELTVPEIEFTENTEETAPPWQTD